MAVILTSVPASVLAIYAHPDDPDVSAGGTLASWAASGADVQVCIGADGDKGSADPDVDPDQLVARRRGEVRASGALLGVSRHHWLGLRDGEIEDTTALRARLVALIRALRPEAVVAPDPTAVFFGESYINHRDHRVIGWSILDAVAPAAANPHYFPGPDPAHAVAVLYLSGTLQPDVWVDITATVEAKAAAIACHASQVGEPAEWLRSVVRQRAEDAGRAAGVAYAEAFRRIVLSE